ncbi:MAG TPA: ATP-binding cassette domain-containing protein [Nitrospirota bacterium]|nr:ATP-binding cassette domain-containing protein [Nitrospirota bacterium]
MHISRGGTHPRGRGYEKEYIPPFNPYMIDTRNLTKYFGTLGAVQSISFTVGKGEVFGLLGPNGAGKTTTIRMLTTLLSPTSGTASVAGSDVIADPLSVKRSIGVVPQMLNLDIDLTCAENLEYHGRLHKMQPADRGARIEELLRFVGLWDRKDTPVEHLSGGMRRRLLIARGLMHRPAVVFMDEPTVGLDPQARRMIWGLIESLKRSGITILLTTHYIEEADALCERVAIMRTGRIIALDRPAVLKEGVGRFSLECIGKHDFPRKFFQTREEAIDAGRNLCFDIMVRDVTLEDVFISLTGEKIEG